MPMGSYTFDYGIHRRRSRIAARCAAGPHSPPGRTIMSPDRDIPTPMPRPYLRKDSSVSWLSVTPTYSCSKNAPDPAMPFRKTSYQAPLDVLIFLCALAHLFVSWLSVAPTYSCSKNAPDSARLFRKTRRLSTFGVDFSLRSRPPLVRIRSGLGGCVEVADSVPDQMPDRLRSTVRAA
ncbi:hypothetical protein B0H14DRAFT_951600 [Mycena olivaceomarginata]|nr:hypothetical protein B0H14DRAFT_951600 [Mycena olivaceomarginata]